MQAGDYQIPEYRLEYVVELTKKIYEKYKSEEATDQRTVAILLGHKSPSGPFYQKIAALRDFGLLGSRGLKVTDLGTRITYPRSEDEKEAAYKEAFLNVPLWKVIFTEFGVDLPKEKFWVDIQRITGLAAPDAEKLEPFVRKAYIEDVKNLKIVDKPAQAPEHQEVQARGAEAIDRNVGKMETASQVPALWIPDIGASISIKDVKTYKAAKIFWDDIASQWEKKIQETQSSDDAGKTS